MAQSSQQQQQGIPITVRVLEARIERHQPDLCVGVRLPLSDETDIRYTAVLPKVVHAFWAELQQFEFFAKSKDAADFIEFNAYDGDPRKGKKFKCVAGCEIHFTGLKMGEPLTEWYEIRKRKGKTRQKYEKKLFGELRIEVTVGRHRRRILDHAASTPAISRSTPPGHSSEGHRQMSRTTSYGNMPPPPGLSVGIMPGMPPTHDPGTPIYNTGGHPSFHAGGHPSFYPQGPYSPAPQNPYSPVAGYSPTQPHPYGQPANPYGVPQAASPASYMIPQPAPAAFGIPPAGGIPPRTPGVASSYGSTPSGGASPAGYIAPSLNTITDASTSGRWDIPYESIKLEKELGRGSFGTVYLGRWRSQKVALKIMSVDGMSKDQTTEFVKEAELMAQLRPHKNCVQLLGLVQNPLGIVLTFMANGTLESYYRSPAEMKLSRALSILRDVAAGISHLHAEGVIHRDLAARNVLLSDSFEAVVSDYGMSRQVGPTAVGRTQTAVGPLKWMAPESLELREFSPASDAFSFGILCIEVFTRQEPYPEMDNVAAAFAVRDGKRPPIPQHVPPPIADIMRRCWLADPTKRPEMGDVSERLEQHYETIVRSS